MNCKLKLVESSTNSADGLNHYICDHCRIPLAHRRVQSELHRPCPAQKGPAPNAADHKSADPPPDPPSIIRRGLNFTHATIKHFLNRMPTCDQAEIDARITVCQGSPSKLTEQRCTYLNPETRVCTHADCGCHITSELKFVSKLAWRDQDCPLGKWPKLDEKKPSAGTHKNPIPECEDCP